MNGKLIERNIMLRRGALMLNRCVFYNRQPVRQIINTVGAINYLHPDVLFLFCHPLEEKAAQREENIWGRLSKIKKTDLQPNRDLIYKAISNTILQEKERLSSWEIERCSLIDEYVKECEQKRVTPKYSTFYGLKNVEFPSCIVNAIKAVTLVSETASCGLR